MKCINNYLYRDYIMHYVYKRWMHFYCLNIFKKFNKMYFKQNQKVMMKLQYSFNKKVYNFERQNKRLTCPPKILICSR